MYSATFLLRFPHRFSWHVSRICRCDPAQVARLSHYGAHSHCVFRSPRASDGNCHSQRIPKCPTWSRAWVVLRTHCPKGAGAGRADVATIEYARSNIVGAYLFTASRPWAFSQPPPNGPRHAPQALRGLRHSRGPPLPSPEWQDDNRHPKGLARTSGRNAQFVTICRQTTATTTQHTRAYSHRRP